MADQKVFAGPRIRRLRQDKGLTQTAMAESLDISPSYLNLIERNQRPLTVQLLLKLAALHQIDLSAFQEGDSGLVASLREAFRDPLLAGELAGDRELLDLVEGTPNAAAAVAKLYRAYRESQARLSDLTDLMAREGHEAGPDFAARMPADELREKLERRPWHFPEIEAEAEAFLAVLKPGHNLHAALSAWLEAEHGVQVRVLPSDVMPNWRRRYERHSRRLFISDRLTEVDQLREIATEAALLRMSVACQRAVDGLALKSDEARRLARFEMGRYGALALMMPLKRFRETATRVRHDLDVLAARFAVGFEHVAQRLVSTGGDPAVANAADFPSWFLMEVDQAGHILQRRGAKGFPQARFGGGCPKLAIHAAFSEPGRVLVETVEMPEGAEFLTVTRTVRGPRSGFRDRPRRTALMIGCDIGQGHATIYADGLIGQGRPAPLPCGPSCRLCERQGCLSRAEPPLSRPLGLDEMISGFSAFDYV